MASAQDVRPMKVPGPRKSQIAVLDANPAVLDYVHRILAKNFSVSLYTEAHELSRSLRESPKPDLLLVDCNIADDKANEDPLGLLANIHASNPSLPIIMLACSVEGELNQVLAAARLGAVDVILKPFGERDIDLAVQRCLKKPDKQPAGDDIDEIPLNENTSFVRCSKRMREIESQCRLVARADIPVLILGESGTGKEVAAMLIHKMSARSQRSFLKVNCAAMPADLLESELFGYEQAPLPALSSPSQASSRSAIRAQSYWTRSRKCRPLCRPSCYRFFRMGASHAWAAAPASKWMCV